MTGGETAPASYEPHYEGSPIVWGPKGSAGATYLTMERANADAMVRGFTGGARGCAIPGI